MNSKSRLEGSNNLQNIANSTIWKNHRHHLHSCWHRSSTIYHWLIIAYLKPEDGIRTLTKPVRVSRIEKQEERLGACKVPVENPQQLHHNQIPDHHMGFQQSYHTPGGGDGFRELQHHKDKVHRIFSQSEAWQGQPLEVGLQNHLYMSFVE